MVEPRPEPSFDLAVVERDPPALALIRLAPLDLVARIALQPFPRAVAVRADRRFAYVAHDGADPQEEVGPPGALLSIVDLARGAAVAGQDLGALRRPLDLAFDVRARLHLLTAEPPTLLRSTQPNSGGYEVGQPLPSSRPLRLLPRGDGRDVFVLDPAGAQVIAQPLDPDGLARIVPLPVGPAPGCMALSPCGRWLVVGGAERAEVTVIDAERLVWYPPLAVSAPLRDLAFDAAGRLHAACADATLWQGDRRGLAPAGTARVASFLRGRPEWALSAQGLVRLADADTDPDTDTQGPCLALAAPVMGVSVA